ncbi:MAG: hypothetical protein K9I69_01725 [Ignavibacteriales bacterium]|nr:hypothetical protein [Ignavibacteriales bacterium]MCF8305308.1 hypothetical protein [Ignavibacteriales bacterium]MCF8436493.1 hypothetical protein [Ignavibacteriales bacterium]
MRSKKIFSVFVALAFISLITAACVEEPEIAQPERPYSTMRIMNATTNVATMNIKIDGAALNSFKTLTGSSVANDLAKYAITNYFDLKAGDRLFMIVNGTDTVYNTIMNCPSWEENAVLFAGTYDADAEKSTFGPLFVYNGMSYLDDYRRSTYEGDTVAVGTDHFVLRNVSKDLFITFVNASTATPTAESVVSVLGVNLIKTIQAKKNTDGAEETVTDTSAVALAQDGDALDELAYGNYTRALGTAGDYIAKFIVDIDGTQDTITSASTSLTAQTLSYFILAGPANNPEIVIANNEAMLKARSK